MNGPFKRRRTTDDGVPAERPLNIPRRCLRVSLACLLWSAPVVSLAQPPNASPDPRAQNPSQPSVTVPTPDDEEEMEEVEELEEEVGDRDPTFLRTRLVFRYDYKLLQGPASTNRFRLRMLYAFGPKQRFAVSAIEPVAHVDTPSGDARGSGDAEVQFNANFINGERFRMGAAVQSTLQTSSDALLGGATTTIKPSWELAAVVSSRFELTAAVYYKQSIHTSRGIPAKQLEPDVTFNARVLESTLFLEWDSYDDFDPGRFAHTLKPGISRGFGARRRWVAAAYYAVGINDYARRSQYRYNTGFDLTWYPWKYR